MHSSGIILSTSIILGMVSQGCRTDHRGEQAATAAINQVDRDGREQGPWEIYHDSVLIASGNYRDGEPEGLWTGWYDNGQMKEEGHYDLGLKNGIWVEWYPDGELMWKGEWQNGIRQIGYSDARADIRFTGRVPQDNVLVRDSTYHLSIRIVNIPVENLFVEANNGTITREEESDIFLLTPSFDTAVTLAIGYIPDLEFRDFRNLVSEIHFKIK